jgi:hypothetical protein
MPRRTSSKGLHYDQKHFRDAYKGVGYNYHGNILRNMLSNELFSNPTQDAFLRGIEVLLETLIDSVKNIKRHMSIAHGRQDSNIV